MNKVILELTVQEAIIIKKAIQKSAPDKEDEMLAIMLFARIARKIDEAHG